MYYEPNISDHVIPIGMLLEYPKSGLHSIWMVNMKFPLDILWLDENKRIIDVALNLQPAKSMFGAEEYMPQRNARYILEIPTGILKTPPYKISFET